MSDVDMDSLVETGIYNLQYDHELPEYHAPHVDRLWCNLIVIDNDKSRNRMTQIASLPYSFHRELYIRWKHDSVWSDWVKIATATKPAVYDLPLAAGMTARTPCRYSKDQFGRVLVRISLDFPPTVGGGNSFLIATMPEGYRPSSITHAALVGVSTSARRIPAALDAHPNGEMWVFADDSTNILVGEVLLETA